MDDAQGEAGPIEEEGDGVPRLVGRKRRASDVATSLTPSASLAFSAYSNAHFGSSIDRANSAAVTRRYTIRLTSPEFEAPLTQPPPGAPICEPSQSNLLQPGA